jgi:hypothetical protein
MFATAIKAGQVSSLAVEGEVMTLDQMVEFYALMPTLYAGLPLNKRKAIRALLDGGGQLAVVFGELIRLFNYKPHHGDGIPLSVGSEHGPLSIVKAGLLS